MKIAILQMTSGIDREANTEALCVAIEQSAAAGAQMLFAPEMSGLLDRDRARAALSLTAEAEKTQIDGLCSAAQSAKIWLHCGSIPCASYVAGKYANRSLIIDDTGNIRAKYDKMHLFDVSLPSGESWRESNSYSAGDAPVALETPLGLMGLSICYDVRFPLLYAAYTKLGAKIIAVPAAFTQSTGAAHWHVMLRARAIESQAFVVAAAQTGTHADGRQTYGHSLIIDPWGEMLVDMRTEPGLAYADLDMDRLETVRQSIPVHSNARTIGPVQLLD
jgi:deaminated glutathione amidase